MKLCRKFLWISILMMLASNIFSQPSQAQQYADPQSTPATLLQKDAATGLELWQTMLGKLWIPTPGLYVIKHLQWEQKVQQVYSLPQVHVQPGDVVIDCGAHIGGFTRVALDAGAGLVIAIEPETANILAFRKNFASELKSGKVKLLEKGVWNTDGHIHLHISSVGDSHSAIVPQAGGKDEIMQVLMLDTIVSNLKLSRVDFIKMDIEGSERKALAGSLQTLKKWKPRMAISSYHIKGDPAAIASYIWSARGDYLIDSKDLVNDTAAGNVPKVLFFR
jgi:FkbM family methyltransferase